MTQREVNCPGCDKVVSGEDAYCEHCGASLTVVCPGCGVQMFAGAGFCRKCGFSKERLEEAVGYALEAEEALLQMKFTAVDRHLEDLRSSKAGHCFDLEVFCSCLDEMRRAEELVHSFDHSVISKDQFRLLGRVKEDLKQIDSGLREHDPRLGRPIQEISDELTKDYIAQVGDELRSHLEQGNVKKAKAVLRVVPPAYRDQIERPDVIEEMDRAVKRISGAGEGPPSDDGTGEATQDSTTTTDTLQALEQLDPGGGAGRWVFSLVLALVLITAFLLVSLR